MTIDDKLDNFALQSFRDQADEDYISARMAFRAALVTPSLWSSHQMVEKYLKCILLLNRIEGKNVRHELGLALEAIARFGKLGFDLTAPTRSLIEYLDTFGKFRYLEISTVAFGGNLTRLDRTAWELRRYCSLDDTIKKLRFSMVSSRQGTQFRADTWNASSSIAAILHGNRCFGATRSLETGEDDWCEWTVG